MALAITGLAASPVIASTPTPTQVDTQPAKQATSTQSLQETKIAPQAEEKGMTIDPQSISLDKFAEKPGVVISGAQLEVDSEYTLTVTPTDDQEVEASTVTVETDSSGAFSHQFWALEISDAYIGNYSASLINPSDPENDKYSGSFEVAGSADEEEPEAPEVDPKVSLNIDEVSASDFEENGLKFTGEGFTPNSAVTVIGAAPQSPFHTDEVTADKDGRIRTTVDAPEGGLKPGDYSVYAVDTETEQSSNYAAFAVTEDETEEPSPTTPAAEAELTISPETIGAEDFVVEDKGVTLEIENCEPGSDVRFVVTPKSNSNVTAYDNTVQADDEGNASVNVYGTSANDPSAYLGDYDVSVTCGDDELTGAFTVGEDPNAGGSDGNEDGNEDGNGNGDNGDEDGNGNGSGDLPRTGTELTGLVGGAALLLIGGAAVTMTMRRKKAAQDPSQI